MINKFILNNKTRSNLQDLGLLILRLVVGFFMLTHGWAKLSNFAEMKDHFPPMLGMSSTIALSLMVFAEFFMSIALILGLLTRLASIPLVIGLGVAAFIAHAGDPFGAKELALLYFSIYVVIFIAGPGRYSVDGLIFKGKKK